MQIKKNPNVDVARNSSLYFAIGLALMVFLSYGAINYKVYDKSDLDLGKVNMDLLDEEEVPVTEQIVPPPPPPPPPPAPEVIEIVEDEEEIEETVIESTETDQEEIVEIEEVEIEEEYDDVDVPFAVIEDVPIYPGCEGVKKSERRNCFQQQINKHIRKNFRYPDIAQEMGIQGRVYVSFIINKDGSIGNVRMRGPDKNLEKEAARIINKLPRMTPGRQRGRPVRVPFSIPITFKLN